MATNVDDPAAVWARHHPPSLPGSPNRSRSPEGSHHKQASAGTWPKAPLPALLQASPEAAPETDGSQPRTSSSSSDDEAAGPRRFWSFTLPSRMRGAGRAGSQDVVDESSSHGDTEDVDGRQNITSTLSAALGDAFAQLTSGTLVGDREEGKRPSTASEEKQAEQGDAEPWTQDSANTKQVSKDSAGQHGMVRSWSFSRHQPLTPGWESPWRPESRGGHSIEFGKYRFNNHGEGGYFPRTETARSNGSHKKRKVSRNGMTIVHGREKSSTGTIVSVEWWKNFLIHNPFVPLLFRVINVAFTTATLAIAIKLHLLLKSEGAEAAVGSSPVVAIVFAPLTLLHVGIQIWLEYFSRPIGLWQVGSKLFYTLIEVRVRRQRRVVACSG